MRFKIYQEYGALNSHPVFAAFAKGVIQLGHEIVTSGEDVAVIWSVLWSGRMLGNKKIYDECRKQNRPVLIIEVGNLIRNRTWRMSLGNINGSGIFGNSENLDPLRPQKLGIFLKPYQEQRREEILIAAQHSRSQQWIGQPSMDTWVKQTVSKLQKYTDRKIVVRPHPRSLFQVNLPGVVMEAPRLVPNSYDDFDIDYNYHCVVNFNSGPAVQAAINGVPVICDSTSLAANLSNSVENIENLSMPDRTNWFVKLSHTEWTVEEIATGYPLSRLLIEIS